MIKYDYVDHFKKTASGSELNLVSDWIAGYQLKGGGSFRVTDNVDVYANAGYVAKVPIFDQVISDVDGTMITDPKNEKFISVEAGVNSFLLGNKLSLKANVYFTNWTDRAVNIFVLNADGTDGLVRLDGIGSRHMGFELEAAYRPMRFARFDLAFSKGDWKYTENVSGSYISDFTKGTKTAYNYYIKDLKVGDAPQMQLAASVTVFPAPGLQAQLSWRYYTDYYSDFDPFSRNVATDLAQVWQIPSYSLLDFHVGYKLPATVAGLDVSVFGHIFNLLDELYVQDATDNSQYNSYYHDDNKNYQADAGEFYQNHAASAAEVYPGLPRTFNVGFTVGF